MFQLLHSMFHAVFSQQMLLILLTFYVVSALLAVIPMTTLAVQNIRDERRLSLGLLIVYVAYTMVPVLNTILIFYTLCSILGDRIEDKAAEYLDKLDSITLLKLPGRNTSLDNLRKATGT